MSNPRYKSATLAHRCSTFAGAAWNVDKHDLSSPHCGGRLHACMHAIGLFALASLSNTYHHREKGAGTYSPLDDVNTWHVCVCVVLDGLVNNMSQRPTTAARSSGGPSRWPVPCAVRVAKAGNARSRDGSRAHKHVLVDAAVPHTHQALLQQVPSSIWSHAYSW